MTVVLMPALARKWAQTGPAMLAPEMRMEGQDIMNLWNAIVKI